MIANKNNSDYIYKYLNLVNENSNNDNVLPNRPMKMIENT
jgi:hypothetical protein